jgi:transposase
MIQITPQMRILVALEAIDLRKGIDGLARVCKDIIGSDPFSGHIFIFRNRAKTSIKILAYDGQGFWLCQKRLSRGRFCWWPDKGYLDAYELQMLLWNGNPNEIRAPYFWKKISV